VYSIATRFTWVFSFGRDSGFPAISHSCIANEACRDQAKPELYDLKSGGWSIVANGFEPTRFMVNGIVAKLKSKPTSRRVARK
jgi:hypothetical protein